MARNRKIPKGEEGDALWAHVTQDVKPLPKPRPAPKPEAKPEPAPATAKKKPAPKQMTLRMPAQTPVVPARPAPPALGHGTVADLDKRTGERLKRGQLPIEAKLDLHGMTQDEAHRALASFIAGQQAAGKRCVIVITGKGNTRGGAGVLREAVPRWLNEPANRPRILAFSHAQPKHGGTGALYVLLRRTR
jgi:DNA-nicking Smr family endonuclease